MSKNIKESLTSMPGIHPFCCATAHNQQLNCRQPGQTPVPQQNRLKDNSSIDLSQRANARKSSKKHKCSSAAGIRKDKHGRSMFVKKNGNKTAKIRKDAEAGRSRGGGGRAASQSNLSRKIRDVPRDDSWELLGAEDHISMAPKSTKQLLNKDFHRQTQQSSPRRGVSQRRKISETPNFARQIEPDPQRSSAQRQAQTFNSIEFSIQ